MKSEELRMKNFFCLVLCVVMVVSFMGCSKNDSHKTKEAATGRAEDTVAINAGVIKVFLDEACYYAYTAQATYEAYYISEGKEINWNGEMKDDVTWQQGVKSTVLDDICRRECMYSLAEEYNVSLSEEEEKEIDISVTNYYSDTNKKLMSKIGIKQDRLKFLFQKQKIAQKVEEIMLAAEKNLPDKTYEKWKKGNTVTAEKQWEDINFNEHLFTLEDIQ